MSRLEKTKKQHCYFLYAFNKYGLELLSDVYNLTPVDFVFFPTMAALEKNPRKTNSVYPHSQLSWT